VKSHTLVVRGIGGVVKGKIEGFFFWCRERNTFFLFNDPLKGTRNQGAGTLVSSPE
jgi:hypothetical protein